MTAKHKAGHDQEAKLDIYHKMASYWEKILATVEMRTTIEVKAFNTSQLPGMTNDRYSNVTWEEEIWCEGIYYKSRFQLVLIEILQSSMCY